MQHIALFAATNIAVLVAPALIAIEERIAALETGGRR